MSTPTQIVQQYYQNLLIMQYLGQPKAFAQIGALAGSVLQADSNIQIVAFSAHPVSGAFKLTYDGVQTGSIAWNALAGTVQTALNSILTAPLTSTVTGTVNDGLNVTFSGYESAVSELSVTSNTLVDLLSATCLPTVTPIGTQLPLEVQDAFNLTGITATGSQLDVIGKYVGVSRTGYNFSESITLDDADYLQFIKMGIVRNNAGSSLEDIQLFLNQFFAGQILLLDYANMNISYVINTSIGSQNLLDLFITENLIPRPMGVGMSIIAYPITDKFFGFGNYSNGPSPSVTPFNSYSAYDTSWLSLSYQYAIPKP